MTHIHENGHDMSVSEYAAHVGVHPRTVKRWLANDELPDASKDPFNSEWRIPPTAHRVMRAPADVLPFGGAEQPQPWTGEMVLHQQALPAQEREPSRLEDLAEEPTFLPVHDAAIYLGIPQAQILDNPETFEVMYLGVKGKGGKPTPRVPKRVIRQFEGA